MTFRVTACRAAGDGETASLFLLCEGTAGSEEKTLLLFSEDALPYLFSPPREVSEEEVNALFAAESRCAAVRAALRLLSYGDNSSADLCRKLRQRGISREDAAFACEKMRENGYLDDDALLRDRILADAREKLWGRRRIEASLLGKGYPREDVQNALSLLEGEIPFEENKRTLLLRKFGKEKPQSAEESRKMRAFLTRYGY
ncbi:MAG: regulatory protein RecX [Clostridia bacterium]|nr:regulatory protein RecX [Clostridia bacterium]